MNKRRVALSVAGAAALSLGLFAGSASAAPGDGGGSTDCVPQALGTHAGAGGGRTGTGLGGPGRQAQGHAGTAGSHLAYPSGDLTAAQEADLVSMADEEKMALDLYAALGERYEDSVFSRIATSEARHLAAVRSLLVTYDLSDPTSGLASGDFADADVTAGYESLLARGLTSIDEAYAAARSVERDDLARLEAVSAGVTAADVAHVYAQLAAAGEKHLDAFGG